MKLTKEQFNTSLSNYIKMCRGLDEICNVVGLCGDCIFDEWVANYYSLLETCCDFTDEDYEDETGTILDFWCFELDFGDKYEEDSITDNDGNSVPLKTIDELYDYIVERQK